jgi:hypothetical protein
MSKRTSFSPSKAAKAALGTDGFVGHTRALLESAAWQRRSIHLVRVLDRLELEHLAHSGRENGFLKVLYTDFVQYGVSRRYIKPALEEGVALGLIIITHQGSYAGSGRQDPSTYQLTYLQWKFIPAVGPPEYLEPTNEWKKFSGTRPERKRRIWNGLSNGKRQPPPKISLNGAQREPIKYHTVNQSGMSE